METGRKVGYGWLRGNKAGPGTLRAAKGSVPLWKELSCEAIPQGKGMYPAGPWRMGSFLLPPQDAFMTVLGQPWKSGYLLLSPSSQAPLKGPDPSSIALPGAARGWPMREASRTPSRSTPHRQRFGEERWPSGVSVSISLQPRPGPRWGRKWY